MDLMCEHTIYETATFIKTEALQFFHFREAFLSMIIGMCLCCMIYEYHNYEP